MRATITHLTSLRKVGGSVMLSVPPALLDELHLQAGESVGLSIDEGRLVVNPRPTKPRYKLAELLAQCDASDKLSAEDRQWLDAAPVGNELL